MGIDINQTEFVHLINSTRLNDFKLESFLPILKPTQKYQSRQYKPYNRTENIGKISQIKQKDKLYCVCQTYTGFGIEFELDLGFELEVVSIEDVYNHKHINYITTRNFLEEFEEGSLKLNTKDFEDFSQNKSINQLKTISLQNILFQDSEF